jgi:hypothetical protein
MLGDHTGVAFFRPHARAAEAAQSVIRPQGGDLWQFVCITCGYLEWHVLDQGALAYIDQQWVPIPDTSGG